MRDSALNCSVFTVSCLAIAIAMDAQQAANMSPTASTIFMLPWVGFGHLSAYLELAKALSTRNFHIYFCSTPVSLASIKPRLIPSCSSIQFVELHLPSSDEFPPHLHTTNGLPSRLVPTIHQAFSAAAHTFEAFLQTLRPHLLIYDSLQPWAPRIASSLNIPAINFFTAGAFAVSHVLRAFHYPDSQFPSSDFVLHSRWKIKNTTAESPTQVKIPKIGEAIGYCLNASRGVILTNSFRELEGKYIDYLSVILKKRVLPIGPLVYQPNQDEEDEDYSRIKNWLDRKEASSTVLVSFGSEFFLSKEETEAIAHGLEQSEANFIWGIRFPKGAKKNAIEEALPEGFLERAGGRAMVVEEWVPQGKILKHGSIGGFVSHCGWNSAMESIMCGVPVIGIPMQVDQPFNAGILEEAGVGVEAKRDSDGKIQRDEVAKLIKEVVVERTREDIRNKLEEINEILRTRREEKLDELATEISLLCRN